VCLLTGNHYNRRRRHCVWQAVAGSTVRSNPASTLTGILMSQHPVVDFSWCSPNRPRPSAKCNGHRELKSLAQWLGLWLGSTKIEVSPKTHERYAEIVRCYLIPGLGTIGLQRLTPSDITRAYASFTRKPSARTRRHIHRILKSALARAVEQQALTRHPADALKRSPKVERRPPATLSVEQSQRLLAGIKHTTTYWPVMLALATGLRRGEIFALRWRNVDLNTGTIRVVESLEQTKAGLRFKSTKSEKGRGVALPSFAITELRSHKQAQAQTLLALGVRQSGDTLVCGRVDGQPKQPASLTHEFT